MTRHHHPNSRLPTHHLRHESNRLPTKSFSLSPPPAILYDEYEQPNPHLTEATIGTSLPTTRYAELEAPTDASEHEQNSRRFVAGDDFFNYEAFGSLRPQFMPVQLFSPAFLGLAVNALAAGFVITLLKYGYRQLIGEYLRVLDDSYVSSIQFLLEWPTAFSLFLGFLSDCRPIGGRRRKPYMIIGWLAACACFTVVAFLDRTAAQSWKLLDRSVSREDASAEGIQASVSKYGGVVLGFTLLATLGVQLTYIASLSMTVEFAQRELLQERGKLQAVYFGLSYITAALAQGFSTLFIYASDDDHVRSDLSIGATAAILALACAVPVPFLINYLDEPLIAGTTVHFSVKRRVHELWRFCHQNVVNRILGFLVIHLFIIGLYNKNARDAVAKWCNITEGTWPIVNAVDAAGLCLSLVIWMVFMVNKSWRKIAGIGSVIYVSGFVCFTALVVYGVARSEWFYIIGLALLDMPRAWMNLYAIVFSTEIADNGREGATLGLVYAFQLMVGMCCHILSTGLGKWLPFHVTDGDVLTDSSSTRTRVFSGSMVVFAINYLSVVVVLLLPEQKLDAQQLRAFGGFNRYASYAIAATFSLLFLATFVLNTLALTK